jgi:adenosylmethionine-8-amino-7-oxononanoate aminotransferase
VRARLHPGENRYKVIARHRGYHGFTMAHFRPRARALRARRLSRWFPDFCTWRRRIITAAGSALRSRCTLGCADDIDRVIRMEGPETVAG